MATPLHTPRFGVLFAAFMLAPSLGACDGSREVTGPRSHAPSFERAPDATEVAYYDGRVYRWQFPSGGSSNQNELVLPDCFRVGPDFTTRQHTAADAVLYAVFLDGANQHACPNGTDIHDHILSAVPGLPGYATLWDLKEVVPGPTFDPSIMPITSEQALLHAADLGQVIIIDDEILLKAVVIGPKE